MALLLPTVALYSFFFPCPSLFIHFFSVLIFFFFPFLFMSFSLIYFCLFLFLFSYSSPGLLSFSCYDSSFLVFLGHFHSYAMSFPFLFLPFSFSLVLILYFFFLSLSFLRSPLHAPSIVFNAGYFRSFI